MNAASEKRLKEVHPTLALRVRAVIEQLADDEHTIEVVQGYRSFEYQQALFEQGRTRKGSRVTNARPGQSYHNYGTAVDLCPFVNGKPNWVAPDSLWLKIGVAAEAQGLEWGGRWKKFPDRPHVQLKAPPIVRCFALYRAGGLPAVWKEADKI